MIAEQFAMSKFASRQDRDDAMLAEIERLRAEVAGLRDDAERYRHMRNNSQFHSRNGPGLYWYLPRYRQGDEGEQLDAAIDAARKGTTPTTPLPSPSPRS